MRTRRGSSCRPGTPGLPRPEIWSLGWRNPWKFSFDSPARGGTGAMLVADVGQGAWEEIDYEPAGRAGRNYGWRVREGAHPYTGATTQPLVDPIYDYDHGAGRSITGGYVYRGAALPGDARALFLCRLRDAPRLVAASARQRARPARRRRRPRPTSSSTPPSSAAAAVLGGISGFGVDAAGELYIINHSAGTILKVVGAPAAPTNVRITR